mmetsp:Transcript_863/g.3110  ORF Transcript_863/g.3110 Transcript_863/m.3110 type:complete len:371 (-) Transcript_863:170-1282(-)
MLRLATAKLPSSCSFDPAPSTYGPRCEPGGPIKYCLVQRRERAAAMSDEFEYGGGEFEGDGKAKVIANQPHDEEIAVSDDEEGSLASSAEDASPMGKGPSPGHGGDSPPDNAGLLMDNDGEHEYDDREIPGSSGGGSPGADGDDGMGMRMGMGGKPAGMDDEDEEEPSEGDRSESDGGGDEDKGDHGMAEGGYDPKDYEHLGVSSEIQELFQYINRYKPANHQLETKLKPFIPDYIPAVGDIDEFIKVPRPDGKADDLGLKVLDEPAAKQSDPTVLSLQLRAVSKTAGMKPMAVSAVEGADKDPKRIQQWIQSINDLHKNKPPPTVSYQKSMPDIEALMQEWPPEMEAMLKSMPMFTADMQMGACNSYCV